MLESTAKMPIHEIPTLVEREPVAPLPPITPQRARIMSFVRPYPPREAPVPTRLDPATRRLHMLDPAVARAITQVEHLHDSIYGDLNIDLTLDYMLRRFVLPLSRHVDISTATMVDCASGYGWLSFAYLLAGGARTILIDADEQRLEAAREIAGLLGVANRCEFRFGCLQDVPFAENSVDVFASVETLEHVGRQNVAACVAAMKRAAKQAILLTTPNFMFPQVAHDTELPFAHWLPSPLRRLYAAASGRAALDRGNHFLKPWNLSPLSKKFAPVSEYQTFANLTEFDEFYPHYMPYGPNDRQRYRSAPKGGLRKLQIAFARALGPWSFMVAPNLASLWVRRA